jgi:hypothetical protein
MRTFHPTQVGTIPSGFSQNQASQVVIGRNVSIADNTPTPEAYGFGKSGRPDFIESFTINLTQNSSADKKINTDLTNRAVIYMDVTDLVSIRESNENAPTRFDFTLKEVSICENGVEKKMVILASQTYATE